MLRFILKYLSSKTFATKLFCLIPVCFILNQACAQQKIKGRVYDGSGVFPLGAVSIMSSSGKGTASDSTGSFTLPVSQKDSVWFSYLGKETKKFAIAEISDLNDFNISLQVNIKTLNEVKVRPHDYRQDSIQNRIDYAKVFNYKKPTFKSIVPVIGLGIVVDLDELIRAFQLRQKKMMVGFQKRLLEEERQKFISHRFTKNLVSGLTGLKGETLDSFMMYASPAYLFTLTATDYEFRKYIKEKYEEFSSGVSCLKKPEE